ncbi:MAG: hypothetical protein M5U19_18930 [Microthrixaceae bacterium]|nr:hypothetical protein [Microthrixaceae bacterium]
MAESIDLDAGEPTDASVDGAGGDGPASVKADSVATATATATAAASRERGVHSQPRDGGGGARGLR